MVDRLTSGSERPERNLLKLIINYNWLVSGGSRSREESQWQSIAANVTAVEMSKIKTVIGMRLRSWNDLGYRAR